MPGMNITRALSFEGIFSCSSLHEHCCCIKIREFPQATTTYIFVCFLLHHLLIDKNLCLQVMDIQFQKKNNSKGLLYFLSKMRQFSVKYLRTVVKLFSVLILSVSSSNFSFSLQSEPKVNLSLEIALSLLSPFALNGFISVI